MLEEYDRDLEDDLEPESDTDFEEGYIQEGTGNSYSEQSTDNFSDYNEQEDFFVSKDEISKWLKNRAKIAPHNIVREKVGVKGSTRDSKTPLEAWNQFER
ncbi:hypothetical protein HHI36_011581 [Cryptolaemus montrouzieri]|uniref:Uncharacterized protein n=1 Tax=Cryptolaemus montrouzieri TaxID=559131 RepID=A0ABD2MM45_9CUCU